MDLFVVSENTDKISFFPAVNLIFPVKCVRIWIAKFNLQLLKNCPDPAAGPDRSRFSGKIGEHRIMWKKILKACAELLIGALVIGGAVYYYQVVLSSSAAAKQKAVTTPTVMAAPQKIVQFSDIIEALGTGSAKEAVDITATVTAKVVEVNFEDGDYAKNGQLLVKLDDAREQSERKQAEINLAEQNREMARIDRLYKSKAVSQKTLDEQKTSLERSKTLLAIANTQIDDRHLRAPFSGYLGMRLVSPGDLVTPGTKITSLDDISEINVDFSVPEKYFSELKTGYEVQVTNVAYPGEKFKGRITAIAPRINLQTRMVEVRAVIDNKEMKLRPGMMFHVLVDMGKRDALMIPEKCVVSLGEKQFVFLYLPNGRVRRCEVSLGSRREGVVEVVSGVKNGEVLVVEGVAKLVDGMSVNLAGAVKQGAPEK